MLSLDDSPGGSGSRRGLSSTDSEREDADSRRRDGRRPLKAPMVAKIILLTGERGSGKSTVCQRAAALAQSQGLTCGGVITIRRSSDTLDVADVGSGETRRLTVGPDVATGVVVGPYRFDPATVAWGNDLLRTAHPCDLLIVDELGPLEFERGQGWTAAFDVLREHGSALALVVVRPWLVERARAELHARSTEVLSVTHETRDRLPGEIIAMVR
jgi:nucleoside-triphosphatase THEP1